MRKRLGAFLMVCTLAVSMVGCGTKETSTTENVEGQETEEISSDSELAEEEALTGVALYETYTADVPKSERDADYYYNINTAQFDKTKYDGMIFAFGTVMEEEITGKTLQDAGFSAVQIWSEGGDIEEVDALSYREIDTEENNGSGQNGYYKEMAKLCKSGVLYPVNGVYHVELYNYNGEDTIYDEDTELSYYAGTYGENVKNLIVPYMGNIDYANMTIDDVIYHLGVPTYVGGRDTSLEEYGDELLFLSYIYAYDEYTFSFEFCYVGYEASVSSISYMGNETFSFPGHLVAEVQAGNITYESYKDYYERQYESYLEAIGEK